MIKFGVLVCDNCRKVLATGDQRKLEQGQDVEVLESSYDAPNTAPVREGVHVCKERCDRGEYYNKSKHARQLMHKHYYSSKDSENS